MADGEAAEPKREPSPSPHMSPKQDPFQNRSFSDPYSYRNSVVFPPINHEGLHNRPPSPLFKREIPSPPSPPNRGKADGCDVARRLIEQLGIRAVRVVLWVRNYWALRRANRSFGFSSVAVAVLVWWVYVVVRWRRRRLRVKEESRNHLVPLIKEKDEKIKQLLHQIAQMNQLFLSLRKSSTSPGGQIT